MKLSAHELEEVISTFFRSGGPLALQVKGFEERLAQNEMAQDVLDAFQKQRSALIEAGTGTGKSLSYLVPAILWSELYDERIVISTNTIALQEQLIHKDIPLALKALGLETSFVLAKGMSNYACLRRLEEAAGERSLFADESEEEILRIHEWSKTTIEGSRTALSFLPKHASWEKVSVQSDVCDGQKCSYFNKCFFFKARREAQEAKIIVVNHHLLFADLKLRMETNNFNGPALLPSYKRLIVDEAHHIEDVATEYFAAKASRLEMLKILSLICQEKGERQQGRLTKLQNIIENGFKIDDKELSHIFDELSMQKRSLQFLINELFDTVSAFCSQIGAREQKLRIFPHHLTHPHWNSLLLPRSNALIQAILNFAISLQRLENGLTALKSEKLEEETKGVRLEIKAHAARLVASAEQMKDFFEGPKDLNKVYWIQQETRRDLQEVQLISAQHDISALLKQHLFGNLASTILCSATLATHKSFSYAKSRLGLVENPEPVEKIYLSPFAYKKQALLGIPIDMPFPDSDEFGPESHKAIAELVAASNGNAFILFTSYEALKSSWDALNEPLSKAGFHLLKQGDDHRHALINRFKNTPRSLLFATDSFWEGIDIVGDALRLVIITKLPFPVPSDPISQARGELLAKSGKSPFFDYSLPKAVVKFKQAFGRLIRHKDDRGSCVCLDSRLTKKGYGKVFLESLPECMEVFEPLAILKQKMVAFYMQKR